MVALSPKSLKELGYKASEEEKDRAFLEVSGRKGLGVKADDLLDRLEEKALAEVGNGTRTSTGGVKKAISRDIASGALRYFMLKFSKNSLIVFDFEEALSFEGETGPYLQYTCVRLRSIFRKLEERTGHDRRRCPGPRGLGRGAAGAPGRRGRAPISGTSSSTRRRLEEEALLPPSLLEFSHLAKFTFNLCQKINTYYHHYPILAEEDPNLAPIRVLTLSLTRDTLENPLTHGHSSARGM